VTAKGSNFDSSISAHTNGRRYVSDIYPRFLDSNAIDLRYEDQPLYGRIDHKRHPVILKETKLTQFRSSPDMVGLNFVVGAFEDLREFINRAAQKKKLYIKNNFLSDFTVKKSYQNVREDYNQAMMIAYDGAVEFFLENEDKRRCIKDFKSFSNLMLQYMSKRALGFPFTLSGMVVSRYTSPTISGLVLELSDIGHDNNKEKYERFINDPNFNFYQNAVRKFGFRLDYNAPWRLVADISSNEMRKYMFSNNVFSVEELFETFYTRADYLDIDHLAQYISIAYNMYVSENPFIRIPFVGRGNKHTRSRFASLTRNELDPMIALGEDYWLNFYFDVKVEERSADISSLRKAKHLAKAKEIKKTLDMEASIDYISNVIFKHARS